MNNYFEMKLKAISENEAFARNLVAGFAISLNPTIDEITDIKTAVSEAITNCIVHAYPVKDKDNFIEISAGITENKMEIIIKDSGVGITDIQKAVMPFYTTHGTDERSGMGFTLMETFMDEMKVDSTTGQGTTVTLIKYIGSQNNDAANAINDKNIKETVNA